MSGHGRGWQMKLLAEMARSSTDESSADRTQSSGEARGASADDTEAKIDSGRETLESSSQGRGRLLKLAMKHFGDDKAEKSSQESPPIDTTSGDSNSSTRGGGRGEMLRRAMNAARQYDRPDPVTTVTKQVESLTTEEFKMKDPVLHRGTAGVSMTAMTNYLPLQWVGEHRIFEYCVQFEPQVDSIHLRVKIISQMQKEIGSIFVFSGFNIFLPRQLEQVTVVKTKLATTNDTYTVTLRLIKMKPEEELAPFLNNLFNKVMRELKFVRHKRKQFDPTKAKIVPHHKLEIWPGYVTAVDTYEGGLMLCLDVSHRRLSTMTVRELMNDIYMKHPDNFHKKVQETLIGKVILTRYNNLTYCIHEVDFKLSPKSTFMRNGVETDYVNYYQKNYDLTIKDLNQPLLLNFQQVRVAGLTEKQERVTCLIPELCYMTGLTDEQMNNTNLKRDLMPYVSVSPPQRVEGLRKFLENVRECAAARKVLENWGLELAPDVMKLQSRELGVENILFDGHTGSAGEKAEFSRDAMSQKVLSTVPLVEWALVYVERNSGEAKKFLTFVKRNATQLGMDVKEPRHIVLRNDTTQEFVRQITETISSQQTLLLVVTIFPTQRTDLYSSVKKVCCYQLPIPSQVVMARTLNQSNESKLRSIVMKILLQMNCKIGGTLWRVNIPMAGTMICGVDAYHDPSQKSSSVTGFVASTNQSFTRWYSTAIVQNIREEVSRSLTLAVKGALEAYRAVNGCLPDRIVIFRDGVGDGQLPLCENFEVPQLIEAAKTLYPAETEPKLTYVVVQKRINTRFFRKGPSTFENPRPGTVVDHTVTRRYLKDFFLISQNVRQGTVLPSHYIIVWDSADLKPDVVQKLAFKLTFMYYNWPGTIRVPACCQYAHKLAYLIGEHVRKEPSKKLQDKLFYL